MQTIYGAGIISAFGPTGSYIQDNFRASRARHNKAKFDALDDVAKGSTLKKASNVSGSSCTISRTYMTI